MNFTYTFETSQPLTQQQIQFLNEQLLSLPSNDLDNFTDVPEYTTTVELQSK